MDRLANTTKSYRMLDGRNDILLYPHVVVAAVVAAVAVGGDAASSDLVVDMVVVDDDETMNFGLDSL